MMMTRREALSAAGAFLFGKELLADGLVFGKELTVDDVIIAFFDGDDGTFAIGVRTGVAADKALVTVFYTSPAYVESRHTGPATMLLSDESIAPVVGLDGYGGTRRNFAIPLAHVDHVRVQLLKDVGGERKFPVSKTPFGG